MNAIPRFGTEYGTANKKFSKTEAKDIIGFTKVDTPNDSLNNLDYL